MKQELSGSSSAFFVTLTISDDVDIETGEIFQPRLIQKSDLQKYFKRLRKKTEQKISYFACGEYGTKTQRPHYHAVIFNANQDLIEKAWNDTGRVHFGEANDKTIAYVTKYMLKKKVINDPLRPFALMSKGLGKIYLKHGERFHKSNFTYAIGGEGNDSRYIPRYYREKIFTKEERELLRQNNLSRPIPLSREEKNMIYGKSKDKAKKILMEYRQKNEINKRQAIAINSKNKEKSKNY